MTRISILGSLKALLCLLLALHLANANSGGLFGDLINNVIPGAGTALDDAHRQIKNAIPPYKALEEGGSHAVNETFVQAGAPALIELIARSRDDALRGGVQGIPFDIRQNLKGFIPENILNAARYRVQGGGDLTLQVNSIRYGEAQAITLDYVIVFKTTNDALYNPTLWAHELTHVRQYQAWGIHDFAVRYLRSYREVENEAYQAETRYMAWAGLKNSQKFASVGGPVNASMVNRPISPFQGTVASSTCGTAVTACQVNGSAPVGTPCWCNTVAGAATGSLIPGGPSGMPPIQPPVQPVQPVGFPPGFGMLMCGCHGPNHPGMAPEPRCASGAVHLNVCPGMCAPNEPAYAYVCN